MERVTIAVDYENFSQSWWDAARVALANDDPVARRIADLLAVGGETSVTCTLAEAALIRRWAEGLPGWNDEDAPEFAPHPLIVP